MTEIAVFGAGFVGVSTAIALRQRGMNALLIDNVGLGAGASFGNAGIIQSEAVAPYTMPRDMVMLLRVLLGLDTHVRLRLPGALGSVRELLSYFLASSPRRHAQATTTYSRLIKQAKGDHLALAELSGGREFLQEGGYRIRHTEERELEKAITACEILAREHNLPLRVLTSAELKEVEPGLVDVGAGAIEWSDPLHVAEPQRLLQCYFDYYLSIGGKMLIGDAKDIKRSGSSWRFSADNAPHETGQIVLATGAQTVDVMKHLGYRVPMLAKRGYHAVLKGAHVLNNPLFDFEAGVVLIPQGELLRVTTGVELGGAQPDPNAPQLNHAIQLAHNLLGAEKEPVSTWSGVRPCMPDMLPVMGRASVLPDLWFNFGHGHQGLTLGPTSGRLLADAVTEGKELSTALSPSRYSL